MARPRDAIFEFLRATLRRHNVEVMKRDSLEALNRKVKDKSEAERDLAFLSAMPDSCVAELLRLLPHSKAQLRQDLLALATCGMKRDGYFVEFGATDGVELSNTYLLEKCYGWKGILAEPAKCWHRSLRMNRSADIETMCVWSRTGDSLQFREADAGVLSTIDLYSTGDHHADARSTGRVYEVGTISLNDLLRRHGAPITIDFLSIDTEGSEFEILSAFDFSCYRFNLIVCEHNFTPARDQIRKMLEAVGYRRILKELSAWDDWFVAESLHEIYRKPAS